MTPAFSLLVLTILAMFSWRYSQAFPLDTVNRAADFMATLRLIYPHADTLCEKDFEWLFDCPETKQFLEWFCSMVGEENVLSPAEVEAYEALLAAGKPILEGDALEEALRMCCQVTQLPSMIADEGPSQEALQQKLQELKGYRDRQLWRYRKLLAWTDKLQQEQKHLEEEENVVKRDLRMAHMDLKEKIFKTRALLSQVSQAAKQVSECQGNMGMGQLPTLLCQTDLGPYLEQEQQATNAFERFIQQVLPESVQAPDAWEASAQGERSLKEGLEAGTQMDSYCEMPQERRGAPCQECTKTPWGVAPASWGILVQGSKTELPVEVGNERDMLSMESEEERDGSQDFTERMDTKKTSMPKSLGTDEDELLEDQDSFWKELGQIETAYICARREVIVTAAKVEGARAALEWAQRTLEALEDNQVGPVPLSSTILCGRVCLWHRQFLLLTTGAQLTSWEGVAEPGSAVSPACLVSPCTAGSRGRAPEPGCRAPEAAADPALRHHADSDTPAAAPAEGRGPPPLSPAPPAQALQPGGCPPPEHCQEAGGGGCVAAGPAEPPGSAGAPAETGEKGAGTEGCLVGEDRNYHEEIPDQAAGAAELLQRCQVLPDGSSTEMDRPQGPHCYTVRAWGGLSMKNKLDVGGSGMGMAEAGSRPKLPDRLAVLFCQCRAIVTPWWCEIPQICFFLAGLD